jgi:outer membrane translocation and assembly module TamA
VYWSLRYDLGKTWEGEAIKLKKLQSGLGIKFSLDTPLGPLELAYGGVSPNRNKAYLALGLFF